MTTLLGLVVVALLVGGSASFLGHVYREAKANGAFQGTGQGVKGRAQRGKITVKRARPAAEKAVRQAPQTVRHTFAKAAADNWVAKRAHIRQNGKVPRTPLLQRITRASIRPLPQGAPAAPVPAPVPSDNGSAPSSSSPTASPAAAPAATPPGGSPMTTPTTNGSGAGGGAASDFFSALSRLTAEARAGGIRSKTRVSLVMGEGFQQQAAALEQYARDLQEQGLYPAYIYEPAQQAAGMLRAAAMKLTESGNGLAALAKTPAGELAGRAPARPELHNA